MEYEYQFPEKSAFRAKEVTEPEFHIQSREDWFSKLWVDFSPVRSKSEFEQLKFDLGLDNNQLVHYSNDYIKWIFSGHRGCGKTVELTRFSHDIHHPDAFFSVFIDLEQETNIEQLAPEDLFVVLISVLIRKLDEEKIPFNQDDFSDIAREWMEETELEKAIASDYGGDVEAKVSSGWGFWKFFSAEGNVKGYYSRNVNSTKTIRQKIKNNPKPLLNKLNSALVTVRRLLRENQKGRDLIFIVDGLEKANPAVYESLFIKDTQMITSINAHLISTVPIGTFYEIRHLPNHDIYKYFCLPMIRVNSESKPLLKELIEKRVDKSLLDPGVLDTFIEKSGGCPRILLKLVNQAIRKAVGKPVSKAIAEEVLIVEGNERWRALTEKHKEILRSGNFHSADKEMLELLQSLSLLEYNGLKSERLINPLILDLIHAER